MLHSVDASHFLWANHSWQFWRFSSSCASSLGDGGGYQKAHHSAAALLTSVWLHFDEADETLRTGLENRSNFRITHLHCAGHNQRFPWSAAWSLIIDISLIDFGLIKWWHTANETKKTTERQRLKLMRWTFLEAPLVSCCWDLYRIAFGLINSGHSEWT